MAIGTGAAILGAAGIGALTNRRGGGGVQTVTQNADPWSGVQPHLTNLFTRAESLYNQGPYDYSGNQSPYTRQAQDLTVQRALDPNSLIARSQGALSNTLAGNYLSPEFNPFLGRNPYLEGTVNDALGQVKSQFAGLYGGAAGQNVNNSGFQEQLARTLSDTALPYYMQDYNRQRDMYQQERQNQLNATQIAPGLDYANIAPLAGVGAEQEALNRAQYLSPYEALQQYQSALQGDFGGTRTTSTPYYTDPLGRALGLGIGGMSLYNLGQRSGLFGGGSSSAFPMLSADPGAFYGSNADLDAILGGFR